VYLFEKNWVRGWGNTVNTPSSRNSGLVPEGLTLGDDILQKKTKSWQKSQTTANHRFGREGNTLVKCGRGKSGCSRRNFYKKKKQLRQGNNKGGPTEDSAGRREKTGVLGKSWETKQKIKGSHGVPKARTTTGNEKKKLWS